MRLLPVRLVGSAATLLLVAACGGASSTSASSAARNGVTAPGGTSTSASAAGTDTATASSTGSAGTATPTPAARGSKGTAAPPGVPSGSGGSGGGGGGGTTAAGRPTSAAPGSYPVTVTGSSTFGTGTPESHSDTANLVIGAPQGGHQGDTVQGSSGGRLAIDAVLDGAGGLSVASVTSSSSRGPCTQPVTIGFSPPAALAPTPLTTGDTHSGTLTGQLQGTWSTTVGEQGTDMVGGESVAVRHVDGNIQVTGGMVCGVQVTGSVTLSVDFAPSLVLFPVLTTTFDFTTPLGHLHATDTDRLQSTHPS